jgi:hypothetical protein
LLKPFPRVELQIAAFRSHGRLGLIVACRVLVWCPNFGRFNEGLVYQRSHFSIMRGGTNAQPAGIFISVKIEFEANIAILHWLFIIPCIG